MSRSASKSAHFLPSPELVPRYVRGESLAQPSLLSAELERYLTDPDRARARDLDVKATARPDRHVDLVSSVDGDIAKILLTIPAYVVDDKYIRPVFQDFVAQLPMTTDLVIVTESARVKAAVKAWPGLDIQTRKIDWVDPPEPLLFSMWAEDAYASARDETTTYLLEPLEFFRYADALLAELIAKQGIGIQRLQLPLYFQGGNMLVGDAFVIIGADYVQRMTGYVDTVFPRLAGETEDDAVRRLYKRDLAGDRVVAYATTGYYGTPPWTLRLSADGKWIEELHCGNWKDTLQPMFHIDMFITLAGTKHAHSERPRVLVGDPRMAAKILGMDVWPDAIPDAFTSVAEQLANRGFDVTRNPLPMANYEYDGEHAWPRDKVRAYARRGVTGANDVLDYMLNHKLTAMPARVWYFATANNAMVEWNERGVSHVWLPTYGHGDWSELAATDQRNAEIWESLGYTVHMLGDFHPFAVRGGGAHCIKKYLRRQ